MGRRGRQLLHARVQRQQINTLYNGIKIGPSEMTKRIDGHVQSRSRGNPERSGLAVVWRRRTGGAVNYVTKAPTPGRSSTSRSRAGIRSTASVRVWLGRQHDRQRASTIASTSAAPNLNGFIDDTYTKLFNVSGQLNYRVNDSLQGLGRRRIQGGPRPLLLGHADRAEHRFPGSCAKSGVVSGHRPVSTVDPELPALRHAQAGHDRRPHA